LCVVRQRSLRRADIPTSAVCLSVIVKPLVNVVCCQAEVSTSG